MESRINRSKIVLAIDKSYSELGHNAYFANGFQAGVEFAEKELEAERQELVNMVKLLVDRMEENGIGNFSSVDRAKQLIKKHNDGISR